MLKLQKFFFLVWFDSLSRNAIEIKMFIFHTTLHLTLNNAVLN